MMAGWHTNRLRHIQGVERSERAADIRGHLLRAGTYFVLAVIYYVTVTLRWQTSQPWAIHAVLGHHDQRCSGLLERQAAG